MFGSDDRIQIANTKIYPFSAIGYLESKNSKGEYCELLGDPDRPARPC